MGRLKQVAYFILFGLGAVTLSACANTTAQTQEVKSKAKLTGIYGAEVRDGKLWFRVKSTGCTRKEDFELQVTQQTAGELRVGLIRLEADYCRAMPRIVNLDIQHEKLAEKGIKVVIDNPLLSTDEFSKLPLRK